MPRERQEHFIEPLKRLSYPLEFVFFDSESYVAKPRFSSSSDNDWITSSNTLVPHVPRLVMAEHWRASTGADGKLAYVRVPMEHDAWHCHRKSDRRYPLPANEVELPTPDEMCAAFWQDLAKIATDRSHGGKHTSRGQTDKERGRTRDTKLTVVAHNVGYDVIATGLYVHLPRLGWTLEHPYDKGPVFITRARKGRSVIEFISSTNFYHCSLADLGRDFGAAKLDFDDFNTDDVARLSEYCRRDVEVCRRAIIWLAETLAREGLGPWRATIASVSFGVWRTTFMRHRVKVHVDGEATARERRGFCGGRTEAWRLGRLEGEFYDVDVNNLYGWVMAGHAIPVKLIEAVEVPEDPEAPLIAPHVDRNPYRLLEELLDAGWGVIADVEVEVPVACVPLKATKLLFPTGTFRTTLCGPELRLAARYGRVAKVYGYNRYEMAPAFKTAVEELSKRRVKAETEKRPAERRLYKDLVTNLYGKFGQTQEEWERVRDTDASDACPSRSVVFDHEQQKQFIQLVLPSGVYRSTGVRTESFNAFPAIAAYITSIARVKLWSYREVVEEDLRHPKHALYCDTDALILDAEGYNRLLVNRDLDEHVLGKMKTEWVARAVTIRGAKAYEAEVAHAPHPPEERPHPQCHEALGGGPTTEPHHGTLMKFKGVPGRAVKVETPDGVRYAYDAFPRLGGHVESGDVGHFHNRRVLKKTEVDYTKARNPNENLEGWLVPWSLPEDAAAAELPQAGI